jgi:hypothetical protein
VIPAIADGSWYLPQGIHAAQLDEVEDRFVTTAPFSDERRIVFDSFLLWHRIVSGLLPTARFWLDGGFVTHKPWAAPSDVDVTVMVRPDELNNLSAAEQIELEPQFTVLGPPRVRPMSGKVDAFLTVRGDVDSTLYWREHWATVLDENRVKVADAVKGFVEVRS